MNAKLACFAVVVLVSLIDVISGHGMIMEPVNRASRWRVDGSEPRDYTDNEGYCGGIMTQHQTHGGRCGFCGDNYGDARPRAHELGGTFGQGVIVKTYNRGQTINVVARITANHKGQFYFRICNLDQGPESDSCFERKVYTPSGSEFWDLPEGTGDFNLSLALPHDLSCNHCVLQWTYVAANNWGDCPDGVNRPGCGPQEHFRTCSDIRIN